MSFTRFVVQLASVVFGLTFAVAPAFAQATHVLVPADKVQWGPAPPALPAGPKSACSKAIQGPKGRAPCVSSSRQTTTSRPIGTA
jgi:hypothetical protein